MQILILSIYIRYKLNYITAKRFKFYINLNLFLNLNLNWNLNQPPSSEFGVRVRLHYVYNFFSGAANSPNFNIDSQKIWLKDSLNIECTFVSQ